MPTYQNPQGGDISTLLRLIQEEKTSSILNAPPAAQTASPVRSLNQGPLLNPEDPTSNRISTQPAEGVNGGVTQPIPPQIQNAGLVPGPGTNPGNLPKVVGAVAPKPPSPSVNNGGSVPTGTLLQNKPASSPSIGTKLTTSSYKPTTSISTYKPTSAPSKTPTTSRIGGLIATNLAPAKTFVGINPGQSALDKIINTILKKTPGNIIQNLAPKLFA